MPSDDSAAHLERLLARVLCKPTLAFFFTTLDTMKLCRRTTEEHWPFATTSETVTADAISNLALYIAHKHKRVFKIRPAINAGIDCSHCIVALCSLSAQLLFDWANGLPPGGVLCVGIDGLIQRWNSALAVGALDAQALLHCCEAARKVFLILSELFLNKLSGFFCFVCPVQTLSLYPLIDFVAEQVHCCDSLCSLSTLTIHAAIGCCSPCCPG
mmetsp:Transcript_67236/g.119744  ORF Transcript_67236/g.119744 Transcript_67236/m.119744 type:complete len:214 (-) Transcript_67236:538-1179(-)